MFFFCVIFWWWLIKNGQINLLNLKIFQKTFCLPVYKWLGIFFFSLVVVLPLGFTLWPSLQYYFPSVFISVVASNGTSYSPAKRKQHPGIKELFRSVGSIWRVRNFIRPIFWLLGYVLLSGTSFCGHSYSDRLCRFLKSWLTPIEHRSDGNGLSLL